MLSPGGPPFDPPLSLEGDVVFSCLKGAEHGDGLILRCFNPGDSPASTRIAGEVEVFRTRLDETGTVGISAPGGQVELAPGEIGTFRLRPRSAAS